MLQKSALNYKFSIYLWVDFFLFKIKYITYFQSILTHFVNIAESKNAHWNQSFDWSIASIIMVNKHYTVF